jgi:hypothetical protein
MGLAMRQRFAGKGPVDNMSEEGCSHCGEGSPPMHCSSRFLAATA